MTRRGQYSGQPGWALVALLVVTKRFDSHHAAATWYQEQGESLPSNCLVPENLPQPFGLTNQMPPAEVISRVRVEADPEGAVRLWDATYAKRARECGVFLVSQTEYLELWHPPVLRRADLLRIFGRVPGTQNPPEITSAEYEALTAFTAQAP
jgi:hypothetical protein